MKRFAAAGLVVLAGAVLVLRPTGADARDPTVKEVMDQLHKGRNPPYIKVKRELQAGQPDWDEVQKLAHEFVVLGSALGKNSPPRGDRNSWSRLAKAYEDDARALDEAARRKDKGAALEAQSRLAGSCMACHKMHRP